MKDASPRRRNFLTGVGPAIITASVVLGPGSILSASKIGHQYAYQLVWLLIAAGVLMWGVTSLSARLGVMLEHTPCDELARRAGRPVAVVAGVSLFLIAAGFQFGNNLGVLAALEPFVSLGTALPIVIIVGINVLIIAVLYGFKSLYKPLEIMMKVMVGLMLLAFAGNLLLAHVDVAAFLNGLIPSLPEGATDSLLPTWVEPEVVDGKVVNKGGVDDRLALVTAMIATTFSVGGAFYQGYLVRKKGWTAKDLRQGRWDSAIGIGTLGLLTMMIMVTAAAVLHGNPDVKELNSAADVARQLQPAFGGPLAKGLFCVGIFAGAFSSFLVNAMIGGTVLSDGLGLGGDIDQPWPKAFTTFALLTGMIVAIVTTSTGTRPVNVIIFAQAMTVLGVPVLAAAMLWLGTRRDLTGERRIPRWMLAMAAIGLLVTLFLAARQAVTIFLKLTHGG